MKLSTLRLQKSPYMLAIGVCTTLILVLVYTFFFTSFSQHETTQSVYIDSDDTIDSVIKKVESIGKNHSSCGFSTLMRHSNYAEHVRTGHYAIEPGESTFNVFRKIKNGRQTPVNITITPVRTIERLAEDLSRKLMMKSEDIAALLADETFCEKHQRDTATIITLFIPNTYQVFWDTPAEKFIERMEKEAKDFWNSDRRQKAQALNLSETEVMTLASIIDEETANDPEKPMVAGMYYNRLQIGMPLQADPTVKFAMKNFEARRIYRSWLTFDSPYNTYRNAGLPPGPIRIPSVAGIDAVLNLVRHNYLYMCAKEDFSGTHNFAATYAEHQQNARKYVQALNQRGIK